MAFPVDHKGRRFGKLTALEYQGKRYWLCRCDCDTEKRVKASHLVDGLIRSCGCHRQAVFAKRRETKAIQPNDIIGKTFGHLTVVSYDLRQRRTIRKRDSSKKHFYVCQCDCGATTIVARYNLLNGNTKSCGCLKTQRVYESSRAVDGGYTPEYKAWEAMIQRCNNPNVRHYKRYGGRGIKVCKRWLSSFDAFLSDMGERPSPHHSIDRFPDNDGNYEPENCRWATWQQQNRNKSGTRPLTFRGETLLLVEWEDKLGLPRGRLSQRLCLGWPVEDALTIPNGTCGTKRYPKYRYEGHKRSLITY